MCEAIAHFAASHSLRRAAMSLIVHSGLHAHNEDFDKLLRQFSELGAANEDVDTDTAADGLKENLSDISKKNQKIKITSK